MNYFTAQRITTFTIVLLVLLNLSTLTMLWTFRTRQPSVPPPVEGNSHVEDFLQQELGLTDEQARQFEALRQQHFEQSKVLVEAIQQLKRTLIEEVFATSQNTAKMQEIAEEIGTKQAELETLRYTHFLALKAVCQPEQLEKFQALFHEIFPPQPEGPPRLEGQAQPGGPPRLEGQPQPGGPPQSPGRPSGQNAPPQPPQEAINACQGKKQSDSCQFTGPHGTITGTCRNIGSRSACVP